MKKITPYLPSLIVTAYLLLVVAVIIVNSADTHYIDQRALDNLFLAPGIILMEMVAVSSILSPLTGSAEGPFFRATNGGFEHLLPEPTLFGWIVLFLIVSVLFLFTNYLVLKVYRKLHSH